jgi:hypothetical protein
MTSKYAWCGVLLVVLGLALAKPAEAQLINGQVGPSGAPIVVGIVVTAVALVVATVLIIHYSKKRAVTGCVVSGQSGMTLVDEKDKQIYMLSGDTTDIKPGDRMKLQGKKVKSKPPDKTLGWEASQVTKNFGACPP